MSRDDVRLGVPLDTAVLAAEFPRRKAIERAPWFRAHTDAHPSDPDRGCWWFASATAGTPGQGRFDLEDPQGTCYFADDIETAVRERLGPTWGHHRFLPPVALVGTTVSVVDMSGHLQPSDVADLDHVDATGFVTREISAGAPYTQTQAHAMAFWRAGSGGLAYRPRFTPGSVLALAIFGDAGRPIPSRAAAEVMDWRSRLRSPVRSTISHQRAEVIRPSE